jgi:C_GCAxxG_C_C family probable redox protein
MNDLGTIMQYRNQGFYCSQQIILSGLEMMGKSNPDLVRSMQGLACGLGFSGELCGALTGGAALLGLYAGKGSPEQEEDPRLFFMLEDLVAWFKSEYEAQYGGIRCDEILAAASRAKTPACPGLVSAVTQKVKELLVENGFELSGLD